MSYFERFSLTIARWLATSTTRRPPAEIYTTPRDVTKTSAKGSAVRFEMVNGAKRTVAVVESVNDVTGDAIDALDTFTELPIEVAPGSSFPLALSRSLANSYPTVVEISWRERDVAKKKAKKALQVTRHYL